MQHCKNCNGTNLVPGADKYQCLDCNEFTQIASAEGHPSAPVVEESN